MPIFPAPILNGMNPTVSQSYGGGSGNHKGNDVMYRRATKGAFNLPEYSPHYYMPTGTPALAWNHGKVIRSSVIGTGGRVEIDHGGGLTTKYYHLQARSVKVGDSVRAGQPVGKIYHNTAGYKLNHLHFEVLKNGRHVDPAPYLANAKKIEVSQAGFLAKVGVAVVAGVLISKYVFK